MRSRTFRPIAAMTSILLLTGVPVQAGPVAIRQVIQVIGNYQNPPELRLQSLTQTPSTPISGVKGSTVTSGVKQSGSATTVDGIAPGSASNSLLAGLAASPGPQRGVEIIDQGDVEGTICDCGEIAILGGGFPKWPLLFLAAIPLLFIDTGGDIETPPTFTQTPPLSAPTPAPTPAPTAAPTAAPTVAPRSLPTPNPVPEPTSLLLFGSGLVAFGAGLRRRHAKAKLAQVDATKEA